MDKKTSHLQMIQAVVSRLATCSFQLKGWAVTLVSALFALAAKDADRGYVLIAYFPVIAFWILDGYYLSQERLFRSLYDSVSGKDDSAIDFSMDTRGFVSDVKNSWAAACLSKTILIFYGSLIVVVLIVMLLFRVASK